MTVDVPITVVLMVLLGIALVGCLAVIADHSARERAWRQIADERRWNEERRRPAEERPR